MTEERIEIGIMELELALQRERAYQAKVARMKLQAQFTFSEVLKPLKVSMTFRFTYDLLFLFIIVR